MQRPHFPLGYSPSLDGARGLMTLTVIAAHLEYRWYPGAIIFMDTFFIMSGYLITSLLIKDWRENGRINLYRFYIRRVYRLFPALLLMLLVYSVVASFLTRPYGQELKAVLSALFYVMNWARAFSWEMSTYLGHTWSLSIEEQFYAAWPLLCIFLLWAGRGRFQVMVYSLVAIGLISMFWRHELAVQGASIYRLYNGTDVRLDALSFGCALAFLVNNRNGLPARVANSVSPVLAPLLSLGLFLFGFHANYEDREWYLWQSSVCVFLSTILVACLVVRRDTLIHRLYEWKPAVFLGRICYGLYIWHFPILVLMEDYWKIPVGARALVGVPLTFLCAILTYQYVELPLMKRRPGG